MSHLFSSGLTERLRICIRCANASLLLNGDLYVYVSVCVLLFTHVASLIENGMAMNLLFKRVTHNILTLSLTLFLCLSQYIWVVFVSCRILYLV